MPETPRLREWRIRVSLSQQELADRSGISRATIASLEAGNRDSHPRTIRRLADALGVAPEDLLRAESEATERPKEQASPSQESLFNNGVLAGRRIIGVDYGACRRALEILCDRWQPILQDAVRQDHLDPETFAEFESLVGGLTPFLDLAAQLEMTELGQQFDEDGDPVFWSERSALWPALGRFQEIALYLNRLAAKHLGEESAVVVELANVPRQKAA